MLAEVRVVGDRVKSRRVKFGERRVGVLAVEAFLKAVNPDIVIFCVEEDQKVERT